MFLLPPGCPHTSTLILVPPQRRSHCPSWGRAPATKGASRTPCSPALLPDTERPPSSRAPHAGGRASFTALLWQAKAQLAPHQHCQEPGSGPQLHSSQWSPLTLALILRHKVGLELDPGSAKQLQQVTTVAVPPQGPEVSSSLIPEQPPATLPPPNLDLDMLPSPKGCITPMLF